MEKHLKSAAFLAKLLDNRFNFLGIRFGFDSILGLVPGLGDAITVLLSLYIVWIGIQMKLPQEKIFLTIGNILIDFVVGAIPILGDIFDIFYKANIRNLKILEQYKHTKIIEGKIVDS